MKRIQNYLEGEEMSSKYIIEEMRKERNISQKVLAEKLGINRSLMSHIETGKVLPSFDMLIKIGRALDCLATDLYRKEDLEMIKNG